MTATKKIIVGIEQFDITEEEYENISKLIKDGKDGLVELRSGEFVNIKSINAIKRIKQAGEW